jgi:hypothetical protein
MSSATDVPHQIFYGITIHELIQALEKIQDETLEVELSIDGGRTHKPISILGKSKGQCLLSFFGDE